MAITPINNGQANNDGTGQTLRDSFATINQNYVELASQLADFMESGSQIPMSGVTGLQMALNALGDSISNLETLATTFVTEDNFQGVQNETNDMISGLNDMIQQQNEVIAVINETVQNILSQLNP